MKRRISFLALLLLGGLALVALPGVAAAQCDDTPSGGGHTIVSPTTDDASFGSFSSMDVNLFTRLNVGVFSMYGWGHGTTVRPGTWRSSFAVLRERLGLKR